MGKYSLGVQRQPQGLDRASLIIGGADIIAAGIKGKRDQDHAEARQDQQTKDQRAHAIEMVELQDELAGNRQETDFNRRQAAELEAEQRKLRLQGIVTETRAVEREPLPGFEAPVAPTLSGAPPARSFMERARDQLLGPAQQVAPGRVNNIAFEDRQTYRPEMDVQTDRAATIARTEQSLQPNGWELNGHRYDNEKEFLDAKTKVERIESDSRTREGRGQLTAMQTLTVEAREQADFEENVAGWARDYASKGEKPDAIARRLKAQFGNRIGFGKALMMAHDATNDARPRGNGASKTVTDAAGAVRRIADEMAAENKGKRPTAKELRKVMSDAGMDPALQDSVFMHMQKVGQ